MDVKDPKNKIIIIYNHGQNSNDKAHKNECIWVNQIRNQASLVDKEINGKKIIEELDKAVRDAGVDYHRVQVQDNYEEVLARFLIRRTPKKGGGR